MKDTGNKSAHMVHIAIGLTYFVVFLLQYSFKIIPKFGGGVALLLLSAVIATSANYNEWIGAIYGLISGLMIDSVSIDSVFFATLFLTLIGFVCGFLVTHIFNRNIPTVLILGAIGCTVFFVAKWLWFVLQGLDGTAYYLQHHTIPSIIYSFVFTLPFYYLFKWFMGEFTQKHN